MDALLGVSIEDTQYSIIKFGGRYEVYDKKCNYKTVEVFSTRRKAENFIKQKVTNENS